MVRQLVGRLLGGPLATLLLVVLCAGLIWWSVMVRLTGVSRLALEQARQQRVEFTINQLRWDRDALRTPALESASDALLQRLVQDPDGLVQVLDLLRELSADSGFEVDYQLGERVATEFDPRIGVRDLRLRFNQVSYVQLDRFMQSLAGKRDRLVLELGKVELKSPAGTGTLNGTLVLRLWTRQAAPEGEDALAF